MSATSIFINTGASDITKAFVRSLTDNTPVPFPQMVLGDNRAYNLYFVDGNGNYADFSGNPSYIPYIAIGNCGNPTSGTWTATFGANTTAALAFNTSTTALATALNALASITAAGGVTVSGIAGQYYIITFNTAGARAAFTTSGASLVPQAVVGVNNLVTGTVSVASQQLFTFALNPLSFNNTWTPITNGWTGTLSANTLALLEAFTAGNGSLASTFQASVQDSGGNMLTYCQTAAQVLCTIENIQSFASSQNPSFVTQAQLAAAVLGLNNFTRQDLTSAATGNTNVTPQTTSRHHTATLTITGTASERDVSIQTTNSPQSGDVVLLALFPDTTAGDVIKIFNASTGGTLLKTITTDASGRPYFIELGYNGTTWGLLNDESLLMAKAENLAGLANVLTAKANLQSLFGAIATKSASFTITATGPNQDGVLFRTTAAAGAIVATLPTPAAGFMVAIQKTDSTLNQISTSPATQAITSQNGLLILQYDGTNWNVVLNTSNPFIPATGIQMVFLPGVSSLVGGTAAQLDGQKTAAGAMTAGQCVALLFSISGNWVYLIYRLKASTHATASPWTIQPVDYNVGTNAVSFELDLILINGQAGVWNATQSAFQQLTVSGAAGSEILGQGPAIAVS